MPPPETIIRAYLDGWTHRGTDNIKDIDQWAGFNDWIEKKFKVKTNHGWARIIDFYSLDEYQALDEFFTLLSEYKKIKRIKESQ